MEAWICALWWRWFLYIYRPDEYEGPYAVVNDSASMMSRDRHSRVRRHYGHDSDSEMSGVTGRSGRPPNIPGGWYPPGPYESMMFGRKGPRSVASSKQSSRDGSRHSGIDSNIKNPQYEWHKYIYACAVPVCVLTLHDYCWEIIVSSGVGKRKSQFMHLAISSLKLS